MEAPHEYMKTIIKIIVWSILITSLTWAFVLGVKKTETAECIKLANQSEQYDDFYYADWQLEMCGLK